MSKVYFDMGKNSHREEKIQYLVPPEIPNYVQEYEKVLADYWTEALISFRNSPYKPFPSKGRMP